MTAQLDRSTYIGSSDIAGILGLSPYQTPFQVWEKKTRRAPEQPLTPERERFFRNRKEQEPIIVRMFEGQFPGARVTKLSITENPNRIVDATVPFFGAEVDCEFVMAESVGAWLPLLDEVAKPGDIIGGEIKTAHPLTASKWGEEGSEDVPIEYATQVQWQLGCRPDIKAGCVLALFGLDDLRLYPVLRDEKVIAWMRETAIAFWNDHVLTDRPPPAVNYEDAQRMFSMRNYRPIVAHPKLQELLAARAELRARISVLDKRDQEVTAQIGQEISQAIEWLPGASASTKDDDLKLLDERGAVLATWNRQGRSAIDIDRLRREQPRIAEDFTKTTYHRVLRFPKGK